MAIELDGVTIPESTGVVKTPVAPVRVEQTPGHPESTGAVEPPSDSVTTVFGPSGQEPTGAVPTPGPVEVRTVWAKVVQAPPQNRPQPTATAETSSDQRNEQPSGEGRQPSGEGVSERRAARQAQDLTADDSSGR